VKTSVAGLFFLAFVVASGCGPAREAEHSPAPAADLGEFTVEFEGGSLLVRRGECEAVDPATVRDWANRAHRDLSEAWPDRTDRFRADGLVMVGMREPITNKGKSANGYWDRKRQAVVFKCGVEIVIRHELFHVWCDRARLPCDCTWIDHPDGFDLDCTPN
jgi:hypothetical protein